MDILGTPSGSDDPVELRTIDPCDLQSGIAFASPCACEDDCRALLCSAGLRPTRQRLTLARLLFSGGGRHVTAEMLFTEALDADTPLSLATVYNTLNQFTQAGLLRRIGPDGSRSFFDTDTSVHPHFYLEGEGILLDVPEDIVLEHMPEALPGHEISRLDVIIHLRRKQS
jgi:Fur family iron response transcriptional regulator